MRRVLFALLAIAMLISCGSNQSTTAQATTTTPQSDCVEVLYFHGKQRCVTCNAIERLTKEVTETEFAPQLKSKELVFKAIDISTPEGENIARQYEVSWSALFINRQKGGKQTKNNMTEFGFAHAKNSPGVFKAGVKAKIEELLKD